MQVRLRTGRSLVCGKVEKQVVNPQCYAWARDWEKIYDVLEYDDHGRRFIVGLYVDPCVDSIHMLVCWNLMIMDAASSARLG